MPEPVKFERLPTSVKPKHYCVTLQPDLVKFSIKGSIEVEVEISKPVTEIKLNSLNLELGETKLIVGDEIFIPSKISTCTKSETGTIEFPSPIPVGIGTFSMKYSGEINDKMRGMYRSKYTTPSGEVRYGAVTQFEATDARQCFPCWDEPALKATFDIVLIVPKDRVSLSNMPILSSEPYNEDDNLLVVKYERSPIMSTYLVAVVVGEYDYVEDVTSDGVKVRVYTPLGKKEQGRFSLEVCTKVIPYYKEYFNIGYPLPKMDLVAISDFSCGAMENWGLVTYRETCLLVDPENSSTDTKQYVAIVVGHEVAHQWFGNLVTMEWWTHLWLNEGYATFVEFLSVDHLFPEYKIWMQFVTMNHISALHLDGLKNSHPIEIEVGHPSEVDEIFDNISYSKGACIIRMLHSFLGRETFRKGMHMYLTRHQYGNTRTEDLWAALGEVSNKPVGKIMSTWTSKMGYPILTVNSTQNGSNRVLKISQQRFLADGSTDNESQWIVPISIITANSQDSPKEFLLESTEMEITLENTPADVWVKLNPGTIGFYRVKYSTEMLEQLLPAITDQTLEPADRLGILDDLFSMVKAGKSSTVDALKLLNAFSNETDYTVWLTINKVIGELNQLLANTDYHETFRKFARRIYSKIGKIIGWDAKPDESHRDTLLRSLVIGLLGAYGDAETIKEAKVRFVDHISGKVTLKADLRSPVYRTVARNSGLDHYNCMIKLYKETCLQEEKNKILNSLAVIKEQSIVQQLLQFIKTDDVRNQDMPFVIISIATSVTGRETAWNFFKENHKWLLEKLEGGNLLIEIIKNVTQYFSSQERIDEITEFFNKHKFPSTERAIQQSLETMKLKTAWIERDRDIIKEYLTQLDLS